MVILLAIGIGQGSTGRAPIWLTVREPVLISFVKRLIIVQE